MTNTFAVGSIAQKALFDHVIKGQLSEGAWENARPMYHWRPWCNATVVVAQDGESVGRNFDAKSDYDLTKLMQSDIVRARMITVVKLVLTFGEPLYKLVSSMYDSIGNRKGLADYSSGGVTDKEDAIRSQVLKLFPTRERLEMIKTSIQVQIYSRKELLEDLKELMATMRLVLK
jgi:hypothetical protein